MQEGNAVTNGGAGRCPIHIYNFNLDTLKLATNEELAETAGYYYNGKKSEEEFNNKLKESSVSSNEKDYKGLGESKTVEEVKK